MDHEKELSVSPTSVSAFVRAVFSEAWTYFSYGGGAVMIAIWGYVSGAVPPSWVFLLVIGIGFLVGGYRTWQKERIDRNSQVARVVDLNREVDELSRPRFRPEVTEVFIDGDHQQPDWIKLYVYLVLRNQGAESAVDRWTLKVVPPHPGTPFIQTDKGLSDSQEGHGGRIGGNLLHNSDVVKRGGIMEGWLLCHGPKAHLGLTTGQGPAV